MSRPTRAFLLLLAVLPGCHRGASDYELPYGASPFAPAEPVLVGASLLPREALTDSAACAACHPEIGQQWASSLHRAAATDPFARFAIDRLAEDYGVAASRLCVACHDPGQLLSGGVDRAAAPDPASRREGISCLACHLVTETHACRQVAAVANASFTLTLLDRDLLFPDPAGGSAATRRHAEALRRPFLSENRFCDSCHRFFIPAELGGSPPGRLRLQSQEAMGTPYGDPAAPGYKSCVDCHMPRIPGNDPAARQGLIHDHRSLGANLLVPALAGDREHVDATLAFRRAGSVTLEVGDFARDADGALQVPVVVRNGRNGHDFPTGATDISETWVELALTDARGEVVFRSPGLDAERYLSAAAPSLTSLVTLRGGDLDFLHDLFSQVELRRHPRVRPGGTQELRVAVQVPPDAVPPFRGRVVLRARHGNERWNRWVFNFADVEVPVADLAEVERDLGTPPPSPPPAPEPAAGTPPTPPEGMVYVPGGRYQVGADLEDDPVALREESPRHAVTLAPFFLDRVPVTNAAYAAAVRAGTSSPPALMLEPPYDAHAWKDGVPPAGLEDHPLVLVTQAEAAQYCRSQGKRLPSEAEWEAAARGREGRRFAWGDVFDASLCNTVESGLRRSVPAGSNPANASPFGALDLGCNVSEWVADSFDAYPRVRHGDNREDWFDHFGVGFGVVRGAMYESSWYKARASARGFDDPMVRKVIGFRCASDAPGGGS